LFSMSSSDGDEYSSGKRGVVSIRSTRCSTRMDCCCEDTVNCVINDEKHFDMSTIIETVSDSVLWFLAKTADDLHLVSFLIIILPVLILLPILLLLLILSRLSFSALTTLSLWGKATMDYGFCCVLKSTQKQQLTNKKRKNLGAR
jgi:hypothetical protein